MEEQVRWAGKDQVVNRNTANVTVAKGLQVWMQRLQQSKLCSTSSPLLGKAAG